MMLTIALTKTDWLNLVYLLAAVLFIVGLKMLTSVKTARRGNLVSSVGMLVAVVATFFYLTQGTLVSLVWIGVALAIGSIIGYILAVRVPMTGMPQMVALLNGFGGLASLLVAAGDYANFSAMTIVERLQAMVNAPAQVDAMFASMPPEQLAFWTEMAQQSWYALFATGLTILVGGVTFTGSLMAFGKLQGVSWAPDKPVQLPGHKLWIGLLIAGSLILSLLLIALPTWWPLLLVIAIASLVLGVLLVIGIGGADMPVVIALLNSYSGIAAAFAGFILLNDALIITGSLVGASGIILCQIMCKAMNRSLMNVLFGGVGAPGGGAASAASGTDQGTAREFTLEDAGIILDAARQVMIVPGYGMAVAQAQHAVKEFADQLQERGIDVKYAIHPVAGRMPGHMNVLLAEAGVPYEQLLDLEQANAQFEQTDVALVIGANDVVNPAARHARDSPIYGMPILDVDKARTVFIIKRSMSTGFAGIQNELFFRENAGMVFGDAKKVVTDLTAELAED